MQPSNPVAGLKAKLSEARAVLRRAVAADDHTAISTSLATLNALIQRISKHLDLLLKEKRESLVEYKESLVGADSEPFTAEENAAASEILTALLLGFDHAASIHRFKTWMAHADPEDLVGSATDVRLKFFEHFPATYIPKTTVARLLRERKAGR